MNIYIILFKIFFNNNLLINMNKLLHYMKKDMKWNI